MQQKIREELYWSSLNNSKKFAQLMELKHYSAIQFRRLADLTKEFMTLAGNRPGVGLWPVTILTSWMKKEWPLTAPN